MCGRYTGDKSPRAWARVLGIGIDPATLERLSALPSVPRYNILPGTRAWVATINAGGDIAFDEWLWAYPTSRGNRINVRSETAQAVPEYRERFDYHRCIVLATGFYEPQGAKGSKNRPWWYFTRRDRAPMFLGGVMKPEGFAILTRSSVAPVASIHDRSPVMVAAENVAAWLDPNISGRDAMREFTSAASGTRLKGWRVGDGAKWAANDDASLIRPADDATREGQLFA